MYVAWARNEEYVDEGNPSKRTRSESLSNALSPPRNQSIFEVRAARNK